MPGNKTSGTLDIPRFYKQIVRLIRHSASLIRHPLECPPDSFPKTILTLGRYHTGVAKTGVVKNDQSARPPRHEASAPT